MVVYISRRFETNIGAKVHKNILDELYGKENIFTFDLRPNKPERKENYICFGKYKNAMHRIGRWMQGNTMFLSNAIIREICDVVHALNPELIFLENSDMGNLVKQIKSKFPAVKTVCFFHDIDADLYKQWSERVTLTNKIEYAIAIKEEKLLQKYTDVDIVFNRRDADLYKKYYGCEPDYILPLSSYVQKLPTKFVEAEATPEESVKKLLFVGTKYFPNIEGIRWFYCNVVPKLNDRLELDIVGRGTEMLREEFSNPRVHVLGTVDDIFQCFYDADVFIAPLFSGGGMKAKSIEAVSMGKCFVGNSESLAGFWEEMDETVRNKVIFNCKNADEWAEALNSLSHQKICKFNPELYRIFMQKFSYDRTKKDFTEILGKKEAI